MILRNTIFKMQGEEKVRAKILLQLHTLFGTPIGSVALDRDFGLNMELVDMPLPAAQAEMSAEIITKIAKYVPSVRATQVKYTVDDADPSSMQAEVIIEYV